MKIQAKRILAGIGVMLSLTTALPATEDADREGGIIGTGIVGTITHLGSIHVNGQHIRFDPGQAVEGTALPITADDLLPGHTVAVVVRPDGLDWQAVHLRQVLPLVGPVTAISGAEATVLGTAVDLSGIETRVQPGDWIAVSGLWQQGRVNASRVDLLPPDHETARISGTYLGKDADGRDRIGDTALTGLETRHLSPGDLVRAEGQPGADGLGVIRLETRLFELPVGVVQIEGYYSPPQPDGLYTVLGSGLVAFTDQPGMITEEERVVRCGGNGQLGSPSANAPLPDEIANAATQLNCAF